MMRYYAEEYAKLPVMPQDENLKAAAEEGLEPVFLTEGLANTFTDERLSWVAEKESVLPEEFLVEGNFLIF
jgi:hypothetical protein